MPTSANNTKHRKKTMLAALEQSLGVVSTAAAASEISRWAHYQWLKTDEEYKAEVERVSDVALDFAESQLFKQMREGNVAATIFYLKTKGKRRGYVERLEVEADVGVEFRVTRADH